MFSAFVFYSWFLLIPIIGVEAYVLKRRLTVSVARASGVASLANIGSTIIGTVVLVGVGILLGEGELPGADGDIVVLFALYPCFYLSVWIEFLLVSPVLRAFSRQDVRGALYQANLFSYAMLAVVAITRFTKSAIVHGQIIW